MGHYEVLGVDPAASMQEIRRSYLRLARESHPDFHHDTPEQRRRAETRMREINAAWAVLGDTDERSAYDRERLRAEPGRRRPFHAGSTAHEAWQPFDDAPVAEFDDRDDRPITSSALPRWLAMVPVLIGIVGVGGLIVGSIVGVTAVVDLALATLIMSAVLFIVAPIFAVAVSSREDRNA